MNSVDHPSVVLSVFPDVFFCSLVKFIFGIEISRCLSVYRFL